jgi:cold-inducible RNA-binding protein
MAIKLFVGSLSWGTTDESLGEFFAQAGVVASAIVIKDKMTGRSKGFGFVEFADDAAGKQAIDMFNGKELDGRAITVNEARPMEARPPRRDFNRDAGRAPRTSSW